MTRLNVTALLLTILLSTSVVSNESENTFDKAEWQYARDYFSKVGSDHENNLFNNYSVAKQAMLLGSTLWLSGEGLTEKRLIDKGKSAEGLNNQDKNEEQKNLAQQLLRYATSQASTLNTFEQGYLHNLLAQTYQNQNNTTQASLFFNKSISVEYPDACINLGVMWEQQKDFKQAEQTYLNCLSRSNEFATPLLYLNLGTIYYNGSGKVAKNKELGAQYWQKSYNLFPFDADINYNLGTYHLNQTKNHSQARYYFAYCAFTDLACSQALATKALIGLYADKQYLQELLNLQAPYQRENFLSDRLKYAFNEIIYFDELTKNNLLFSKKESTSNQVVNVSVTFKKEQTELATAMLNRLIYIDMFTGLNIEMLKVKQAALQKGSVTLHYLNQKHNLEYKDELLVYSIELINE